MMMYDEAWFPCILLINSTIISAVTVQGRGMGKTGLVSIAVVEKTMGMIW